MGFIGPVGEVGLAGEKVNNLFLSVSRRFRCSQDGADDRMLCLICIQGDRGEMGLPGPPGEKGSTVRHSEPLRGI